MEIIQRVTEKISNAILYGFKPEMSDIREIEKLINDWKLSEKRCDQIKGQLYYQGDHDIKYRKRQVIGEDGNLEDVNNLPNNQIIDNQYGKAVDMKANYLVGNPFTLDGDDEAYKEALSEVFNKRFMKTLKEAVKGSMNTGIGWFYPFYNQDGEFSFRYFPGYEILPIWEDSEHTRLQAAIRLYIVKMWEGQQLKDVEKVEVFDQNGVHCYILDGASLTPDNTRGESDYAYVTYGDESFNWERIPLIPIKYNEQEIPLLNRVKSLQDGINTMLSDFENNMQEDARNTILVLKNYDGTNLGEFRRNLATYGAVKVRYDGETKGGVETLEVKVDASNYDDILRMFKKALIENAKSYDAKDDKLGANPNQMNIMSMYSDIDLDANDMETELQATFEDLLWFVNNHLMNTGSGDYSKTPMDIEFNRDIMMNEGEIIANCVQSVGIISEETILSKHPWVDDVDEELERLEAQRAKEVELYDPFAEAPVQEEKDAGDSQREENRDSSSMGGVE
jgi:SPP1 family phage portal protein